MVRLRAVGYVSCLFLCGFIGLLCVACHTRQGKPDTKLVEMIEAARGLDSSELTCVELSPPELSLPNAKATDSVRGMFWVKNRGPRRFHIDTVCSPCSCVSAICLENEVAIGDSIPVAYSIAVNNGEQFHQQIILVVGNCECGNAIFGVEIFINKE